MKGRWFILSLIGIFGIALVGACFFSFIFVFFSGYRLWG